MSDDLFDALPQSAAGETYDGSAIEVLEGLEPVRRRPGMYIGGIDERAFHHLAAEVLDNAMDEAVAGHANGSIVVGETRTALIRGGMQGVSRDVTELRELQDRLEALALRDPLTGLSNRRLFDELLATNLARAERSGSPLAIAFLDLDGLKYVNDVYGHDAGDIVLRETARRLRKTVRGADTVARLGGDEFVVLYAPNEVLSQSLIARIDAALSEPIEITANISVTCPASLGVADTGTVGYDSAVLLAAADEAMYDAKRARRLARGAESPLIRTTV